ncbi:hypothetical protein ACFJXP_11155 [Enterococcus faecalis]
MYRLHHIEYLIYFFLMIFIYVILIAFLPGQVVTEFDREKITTIQIIYHNLTIFFKWQVLFIFSPVYWLFETFVLSWTIKTGINTFGVMQAFQKIFKHGIIEIPNMFLYQLLSIRLFYFWWKKKKFKLVIEYVRDNINLYTLSIAAIIISGLIEGMTW